MPQESTHNGGATDLPKALEQLAAQARWLQIQLLIMLQEAHINLGYTPFACTALVATVARSPRCVSECWVVCRELEQLKELNRRLALSTAEGPTANGNLKSSHTFTNDAAAAQQALGAAQAAAQTAEARAQQAETQAAAYQSEAKALQGLCLRTAVPCRQLHTFQTP